MFHKLIESIRHINHPTGFESYLNGLQGNKLHSNVTIDEAKRDYREALRTESKYYRG